MRFWLPLALAALAAAGASAQQPQYKTRNIVLVTADGLRWQEVFRGIDPLLMDREETGMKGAPELRERLWAETPGERRVKLLPFLWSEVAAKGVLLGDRDRGGSVELRNQRRFSYPGYAEILTGKQQDEAIDSNDLKPNPSRTVLEILRGELNLAREQAALFGSWNVFQGIGARNPEAVFINAGFQALPAGEWSPRMRELSQLQFDIVTPWRTVRHDYITFEMALEHLRQAKPRALYLALGETDDWAHDRRYDRVLETAEYFDRCLARLWQAIEGDPFYAGKTTLIVSTDHGRGGTPDDWHGHGARYEGSQHIWIAAIGPDTPAGGTGGGTPYYQSDIAPTVLELMGVDYRKLDGVEGKPVAAILGK